MQSNDKIQPDIDGRYRTLITLWAAMFLSVLSFLLFINLSKVEPSPNPKLSLALNTFGLVPVALSFLVKPKILEKSIEAQRLDLVQVGHVAAFALCEISALAGVVDHFITGSLYYLMGFAWALIGIVSHFPQRKYVLAASNKEF